MCSQTWLTQPSQITANVCATFIKSAVRNLKKRELVPRKIMPALNYSCATRMLQKVSSITIDCDAEHYCHIAHQKEERDRDIIIMLSVRPSNFQQQKTCAAKQELGYKRNQSQVCRFLPKKNSSSPRQPRLNLSLTARCRQHLNYVLASIDIDH